MVLFTADEYPVATAVLAKLNVVSTNAAGYPTVPNLSLLLDMIYPKNEENFTHIVSILKLCIFSDISTPDFPL